LTKCRTGIAEARVIHADHGYRRLLCYYRTTAGCGNCIGDGISSGCAARQADLSVAGVEAETRCGSECTGSSTAREKRNRVNLVDAIRRARVGESSNRQCGDGEGACGHYSRAPGRCGYRVRNGIASGHACRQVNRSGIYVNAESGRRCGVDSVGAID
jgi:hypothetical protein